MTVAYNRSKVLEVCIKSLLSSHHLDLFDIFIIDNGSHENIKKMIGTYPVKYLRLKKNFFASFALNRGFSHFQIAKKYKYVVLMGSDVLVDKRTIIRQFETMEESKNIGMTGPAHYDIRSNKLLTYGITINPSTSRLINTRHPKAREGMNHFHSMYMVRTSVYKKLDGLDHVLFPMIFEEPDLGQRIFKAGYSIVSSPRARIWHSLDQASKVGHGKHVVEKERLYDNKAKAYLFFRNRIIYMSMYSTFAQFLLFYFLYNPLIFLYYLPTINPRHLYYAIIGIWHGTHFNLTFSRAYITKQNRAILKI